MESLRPEVSILMPVRQWRTTTVAAVESLLAQTMRSFELLLIGQADIGQLTARLPQDARIRPLARRQPGIVGALNTGLAEARGKHIARMDDDDVAHPERLAQQLQHLQGPARTELCATRIRFIDANGKSDSIGHGSREYEQWLNALTEDADIRAACHIECPMPHPTLLAHRDVWHRIGCYRDIDGPEDYDLVLRAKLLGIRLGKPEAVLLDWRQHDDRLTYRDQRYRREAFARCRARAASDPRSGLALADGRRVWLCGTGRNARHWHDALAQEGVTVEGFVDLHRHGPQRSKRGKPVISYEQLPERRRNALVIAAVAGRPARAALLDYFARQQWRNGREFILGG